MIDINVVIEDRMQRVIDAMEKSSFENLGHAAERIVERAKRSIRWADDKTTRITTLEGDTFEFGKGELTGVHARLIAGVLGRIEKIRNHSQPGEPPFSSFEPGHNLRDAIKWSRLNHTPGTLDDIATVIGTDKSEIGNIGEVMERGGEYKGEHYEPRPFIWPAFQAELDSVAPEWAGAV